MAITALVLGQDASTALSWRSMSIKESIGQPDTLRLELNEINDDIRDLVGPQDNYYFIHITRDADLLFSGLARGITRRNNHGVVTYTLRGVGWEHLAAKRLVGVPGGFIFEIQEDGDEDRLPTPVAIDANSTTTPTAAGVSALWANYWQFPTIDLTTYVFDTLPVPGGAEPITFSGTDVAGATDDLAAAGSAAAMWWLANDSPDPQSTLAPNLALHFGLVALPDDGDDGDDLLLGFPSADFPVNVAPYAISDDPADVDFTTTIMASAVPELDVEHDQRVGAVYVRGATGWVVDVFPAPPSFGYPYQVGDTHVGGTGWAGDFAGPTFWGEAYVDAPGAISQNQRDAFGNAYLGAHSVPQISGTFLVEGYDGWHKGQALKVTDTGLGLDERWLLIRSVSVTAKDSAGEAMSYALNVGDVLTPQIGYELRQQRLKEQRKEIRPATRFIPFVGDLQLNPGETAPLTMQLANDAGKAMAVNGVGAEWHLLLNGADVADPEDTGELFYLTDLTLTTDQLGQVKATLHAHADVTSDDAVKPWCAVMIP